VGLDAADSGRRVYSPIGQAEGASQRAEEVARKGGWHYNQEAAQIS
jgi:hypothetical protein